MSRRDIKAPYLRGNDHRVADPSMFPEMNVTPTVKPKKSISFEVASVNRLQNAPANPGSTHMDQHLSRSWLRPWLHNKVDFMLRVVKRSNVTSRFWFLSCLQYPELGMIQDRARIVKFAYFYRHREIPRALELGCLVDLLRVLAYWEVCEVPFLSFILSSEWYCELITKLTSERRSNYGPHGIAGCPPMDS